eukprot:scaffold31018_cov63-Phaeocystis_antarctica.AAC.6
MCCTSASLRKPSSRRTEPPVPGTGCASSSQGRGGRVPARSSRDSATAARRMPSAAMRGAACATSDEGMRQERA